ADAFVRGVNAAVAVARAQLPEAFELAGWAPDLWEPDDLLNRTDAFLAGGDALEDVARAGMSVIVADAIRRIGTRPFFSLLARDVGSVRDARRAGVQTDRDPVRLKPDTARDRE